MSESQRAAEQSAWDRHVRQALAIVAAALRRPSQRKLAVLSAEPDDLTTPPPGHPAWRGLTGPGRENS